MPTKLGKGGHGDQNYVPAGNGDASGEYGDNATGSNIHFTNFKKPDEGEEISTGNGKQFKKFTKTEEKPKVEENKKEQDKKNVEDNLASKFEEGIDNPKVQKAVSKIIETSNEEGLSIINDYIVDNTNLKINFNSAGRNAAGRAWGYGTINTNTNPHTIRHELGHTFDNWYGKDLPENGRGNFESQDYASVRFVDDETGKTMNEMLHEELGVSMYKATFSGWKVRYLKQGVDKREKKLETANKINEVFNKYADKIFDEITGIPNSRLRYRQLREEYNKIGDEVRKEIADTEEGKAYQEAKNALYKEQNAYFEAMVAKGAYSINYSNSPEVQKAQAIVDTRREKYNEKSRQMIKDKFGEKNQQDYDTLAREQYNVYQRIEGVAGLVGDTFDYLDVGSTFYSTNGHGKGYFNERKEAGYCLEIFANMFDCYASKDEWKKDFVREAFPKTAKIFEKIYYKKGRK